VILDALSAHGTKLVEAFLNEHPNVELLVGVAGGDHFPEKAHEVPARVRGGRLAPHLAGPHVQRRRATACLSLVFEALALDPVRRHGCPRSGGDPSADARRADRTA